MWHAVGLTGGDHLTPMAAVAGAIADATADYLEQLGMTRVVVNNGGDLAIRLQQDEIVTVGIRRDVQMSQVAYRVRVTADMGIGGVSTSGLGGRSLTRGIASAVTVFANRAAVADAAATELGNRTSVETPVVIRKRAEEIDPETDLVGLDVTVSVGPLTRSEIEAALSRGIGRADELVKQATIRGAMLFVKGRMRSAGMPHDRMEERARPR